MILEGIVTTQNSDGSVNIAPMGANVSGPMRGFQLRPYRSSTTFQNLRRLGAGVLHVTDDVLLLAQAAIGPVVPAPKTRRAATVDGQILLDACRWYTFKVTSVDDRSEPAQVACDVAEHGRERDFFGFNRGKHAVLEAAILATRIDFLPAAQIEREYDRLETIVEKTGGEQEQRAFRMLSEYLRQQVKRVEIDR